MKIQNNKDLMDLGGFTIKDWKFKREILKNELNYSSDWDEVVTWYNNRLKVRYFDPMKRIEKRAIGEGFSLATIHCVLIEHFASITTGKIHNHNKKGKYPKYEYVSSLNHFKEFLETSNIFAEYFAKNIGSSPLFESNDFYKNVRCALLHEACTKNNWRINTLSCGYTNPYKKILIKDVDGVKRLFRDVLTERLCEFLENYKLELKTNEKLRLYFARKIDHLCEIKPDKINYKWWEDL